MPPLPSRVLLGCPLVLFLARRPSPAAVAGEPAAVAVVIPTLNEEGYQPGKLRDDGLIRWRFARTEPILAFLSPRVG